MLNQAQRRELKKVATDRAEEVFNLEGHEVVGQTREGVAVENPETGDFFIIKVIVKDSNKFDLNELIEEKQEYDKAQAEKAEKAKKAKAKPKPKKDSENEGQD